MLRGAIEIAETARIAGWIVSAGGPLRGKTVLAFSGARCVGAGTVSVYRSDLVSADLGDGFSGFDFAIELERGETVGSVVIRLELCDAALIQAGSEVVARAPAPSVLRPPMPPHETDRRTPSMPLARRA